MNPMAYRGPGQTLVGYEPPPAWSPPTPEQESLREPWIDPTTAFAGGFGANIMRRGLMGALRGGTAAAVADYPLGLATAGVENIDPRLAMPFNLIGGMASGASFERGLENAMAGKAHPVRTAQRALGNAMGQVDVWHGSPHSFDRFSMDKIGTGEGHQAFGHGLYFTDMKGVAKHYAEMLSEDMQFDALSQKENKTIPAWVKQRITRTEDIDEVIKDWHERIKSAELMIENSLQPWLYENNKAGHIETIKALEKLKKSNNLSAKKGNVYKATLHKGKNPSEYVYLDWDKPLSEQPKKYKSFSDMTARPALTKRK
jgi:hypothetical protein